jgi:hypothetical protein
VNIKSGTQSVRRLPSHHTEADEHARVVRGTQPRSEHLRPSAHLPLHATDASDNATGGDIVFVEAVASQLGELKKR